MNRLDADEEPRSRVVQLVRRIKIPILYSSTWISPENLMRKALVEEFFQVRRIDDTSQREKNSKQAFIANLTRNFYSHSIVAGGLLVTSYTILFIWSTSFIILTETLSNTSYGILTHSAVIKSVVWTALSASV